MRAEAQRTGVGIKLVAFDGKTADCLRHHLSARIGLEGAHGFCVSIVGRVEHLRPDVRKDTEPDKATTLFTITAKRACRSEHIPKSRALEG